MQVDKEFIKDELGGKSQLALQIQELSEKELTMLEEKNWMNDKIINFCLELFRFKYKQILILDSFFMEIIKKRRNQKVFKTILKKKIFNNKRIILPVNRKNSHWYFVYICESKIYLIDSMNNNGEDKELILNWAKKTIKIEGINRDLEWDKNDTPDQYKQETSWSCGLWVLCGIHFICKNIKTSHGR